MPNFATIADEEERQKVRRSFLRRRRVDARDRVHNRAYCARLDRELAERKRIREEREKAVNDQIYDHLGDNAEAFKDALKSVAAEFAVKKL